MITISGPYLKSEDQYLSHDGNNPDAPWPGYGWPLDTKCWYFRLSTSDGALRWATGLTIRKAWTRALELGQALKDGVAA